jgi:hypothetical protein
MKDPFAQDGEGIRAVSGGWVSCLGLRPSTTPKLTEERSVDSLAS